MVKNRCILVDLSAVPEDRSVLLEWRRGLGVIAAEYDEIALSALKIAADKLLIRQIFISSDDGIAMYAEVGRLPPLRGQAGSVNQHVIQDILFDFSLNLTVNGDGAVPVNRDAHGLLPFSAAAALNFRLFLPGRKRTGAFSA
nr:hypothetical protein [Oscillibacter sp. 1-3]